MLRAGVCMDKTQKLLPKAPVDWKFLAERARRASVDNQPEFLAQKSPWAKAWVPQLRSLFPRETADRQGC